MRRLFWENVRSWSVIAMLGCGLQLSAQTNPMVVRHVQGTLHGFLEVRSEGGLVVGSGDITQVVRGDRVRLETLLRFKDGSMDDEVTVFSQRRAFHLISDHHIQKGRFFPHPMDMLIDAGSGQVAVRSTGKDGKEEVKTGHFDLPPDLANGMVPLLTESIRPGAPDTTVSIIVATPKPRLLKLVISSAGEDTCSIVGVARRAVHYKIELGGMAGVLAPLIGKAPPTIQIWAIGGDAPTFIREQGPLYLEGPMMTIQLASPVWPSSPESGH